MISDFGFQIYDLMVRPIQVILHTLPGFLIVGRKNNEIRVVYLIAFTFVTKISFSCCPYSYTIFFLFFSVPVQALLHYGIKKPGNGGMEGRIFLKE